MFMPFSVKPWRSAKDRINILKALSGCSRICGFAVQRHNQSRNQCACRITALSAMTTPGTQPQ
jgi:hypothetical protein